MKKKNQISANYLEKIPSLPTELGWKQDGEGKVTLEIENKGWANKLAQKLFKRPKFSFVHLDEFGSFVWLQIDSSSDITAIGEKVKEHFGENAEPLYPRLAKFFQILDSYGFVNWIK